MHYHGERLDPLSSSHYAFVMPYVIYSSKSDSWPGPTIKYGFTPDSLGGNDIQREKVNQVINGWGPHVPTFERVENVEEAHLRISFDSSAPSWSYMGIESIHVPFPKPNMNLAWVRDDSPTIWDTDRGVILHQVGHLLGLVHEHDPPPLGTFTLKETGT